MGETLASLALTLVGEVMGALMLKRVHDSK